MASKDSTKQTKPKALKEKTSMANNQSEPGLQKPQPNINHTSTQNVSKIFRDIPDIIGPNTPYQTFEQLKKTQRPGPTIAYMTYHSPWVIEAYKDPKNKSKTQVKEHYMPMNFQQKSDTANHNPMNVSKNLQNVEITAGAFGSKANELEKLFDG